MTGEELRRLLDVLRREEAEAEEAFYGLPPAASGDWVMELLKRRAIDSLHKAHPPRLFGRC